MIKGRISNGKLQPFSFRMGIHIGEVFRIWDMPDEKAGGRWNYIGDGINGGQRILETTRCTSDVIHVSEEAQNSLGRERGADFFGRISEYMDKSGRTWRYCNLKHDRLVNAAKGTATN